MSVTKSRAWLLARAMRLPPPPDLRCRCGVCGVELPARAATFDELARVRCGSCVGRIPEAPEVDQPIRGKR